MSIQNLATSIKNAVDKRIDEEARAKHGVIRGGRLHCGAKSFPFTPVVDCNTSSGNKVWAQLDTNGKAIVVGD